MTLIENPLPRAHMLSAELNGRFQTTAEKTIAQVRSFRLTDAQKILLKTVALIAIKIFFVFACVAIGTFLPFHAVLLPGFAVGGAFLTAFFFSHRHVQEKPPPVFQRLPPLLQNMPGLENFDLDRGSGLVSHRPIGLYYSGRNSAFNSLVHYLDADPAAADRLRKCPSEGQPFSQFFKIYDRAVEENRSIADANSQSIRYAFSQIDPTISQSEDEQADPAEILQKTLNSLPDSHLIEIEKITIHRDRSSVLSQKGKKWGFDLDIGENPTSLLKLFQDLCLKNDKNSAQSEHIVFQKPPPVLRFRIERFPSEKIMSRVLGRPAKIDTPVEISSEFAIRLQNGQERKYNLASLVYCEGPSFETGRFIAGRIVDGKRYVVDGSHVIPVDRLTWEQKIVPQAYLLLYLPAPLSPER